MNFAGVLPDVSVQREAFVLCDLGVKSALEALSVTIKWGNEEPLEAAADGTVGTSAGPQGKAAHPAAFLYKEISLTKLLIC